MDFTGEFGLLQRRIAEVPEGINRRLATLAAIDPQTGESVLDIGCGAGHLLLDLARNVGPEGRAIGIDVSADQVAAAAALVADEPAGETIEASATEIPLDDASLDAIASIQTLDYVDDIAAALAECRRIIRPGGRLVTVSVLWDHWRFHGADQALNDQIHDLWRDHCPHQMLPVEMPRLLAAAGFGHVGRRSLAFINQSMTGGNFAGISARLIAMFAVARGLEQADADRWLAELAQASAEGRFLFVSVPVLTTAIAR